MVVPVLVEELLAEEHKQEVRRSCRGKERVQRKKASSGFAVTF